MLILQKNSFNIKDKITNFGFIVSVALVVLIFFVLPAVFRLLRLSGINPVLQALLPSVIIIPALCISIFFVGRTGDLPRKLKLVSLRLNYIPISFLAAAVLLAGMTEFINLYHRLLAWLDIKTDPPVIEMILKNCDFNSFLWICFGIIFLAPIAEELVFRRFMFGFFAPRLGFFTAMALTAGIFAGIHFSLYNMPALFLLGIGFQLIYLKFGSLYPAILMHAFNNAIALNVLLFFPHAQT